MTTPPDPGQPPLDGHDVIPPAPGPPEIEEGSPPVGSGPIPPQPSFFGFGPAVTPGSVPPTPPPFEADLAGSGRKKGRGWLAAGAVVSVAALLAAGFFGRDLVDSRDSTPATALGGATPTSVLNTNKGPTTPIVPATGAEPVVAVARALTPAVVQIQTSSGLGSGIIYDSTGLIMTNAHVVGNAQTVQVNLYDGSKLQGTVKGADTSSDIAVVKVDPGTKTLAAAKLATAEPAVGSVAVAIGSPFGLSGSVTAGVVSAIDRPVDNTRATVNMIQTDAPINPGNSGGALANRNAEVIGINAEIYSQTGSNSGIGFAIPIATAKSVADKITSGASLARPLVGVGIRDDPNGGNGAFVAQVQPNSAAAAAGLQVGDIVTAVNGSPVATANDFRGWIGKFSPGQTITLRVVRGGATKDVAVTLGSTAGN